MAEIVYGEGTVVKTVEPEKVEETKQEKTPEEQAAKAADKDRKDRARAEGWRPKEEWQGDPEQWRSAKEFLDRGELLGKIKSQSQEIREVKKLAESLSQYNKNVFIASYEKALADLTEAKAKALDEGGKGKKVVKLDEAIDQTRTALAQIRAQPVSTTPEPAVESPAFVRFKEQNPLYKKDPDFVDWAHGVALRFAKANDGATEQVVYDYITERAKTKYPNQGRTGPPSPDGEGRSSGGNSSSGDKGGAKAFDALIARLPEEHAAVAKDLVKRGYVTKE